MTSKTIYAINHPLAVDECFIILPTMTKVLHIVPNQENPATGTAHWRGKSYACALGKNGVINATQGREGDGKTPAGLYSLLYGFYRKDRLSEPESHLRFIPLTPNDGWCDEPTATDYNQFVLHPSNHSAEHLWRDDALYDLIIVNSHNSGPKKTDLGSAIFLHVARDSYQPTQGCVAFAKEDLIEIIKTLGTDCALRIHDLG